MFDSGWYWDINGYTLLVNEQNYGKIHHVFMGRYIIFMAILNSKRLVHQRVNTHVWWWEIKVTSSRVLCPIICETSEQQLVQSSEVESAHRWPLAKIISKSLWILVLSENVPPKILVHSIFITRWLNPNHGSHQLNTTGMDQTLFQLYSGYGQFLVK